MPQRQLHDEYFRRAKEEGYLARSAYKLLQIQEAKRILRKGDRVLDLGCAPGAWIQAALETVGRTGRVVGLDLQEVRVQLGPNVTTIVGDVFKIEPDKLLAAAGGRFDCILSDMAPNTSGHGDAERSAELCRRVLDLIPILLKPTGHLAMKVLEGGDYPDLLAAARALFADVKGYKPAASRSVSREMYIIGRGFVPAAGNEAGAHGGPA